MLVDKIFQTSFILSILVLFSINMSSKKTPNWLKSVQAIVFIVSFAVFIITAFVTIWI